MRIKNRAYDFLFYFVIGTLYAYALSQAVVAATILEIEPLALLAYCALFIPLFYVIFFNKYTVLASLGVLVAAGIWLFVSLSRQDFGAQWYLDLGAFVNEVVLFAQNQLPARPEYNRIFSFFFALMFAFLTALNMLASFNYPVLAVMGLAVILVPVAMDWGTSDSAVLLFILCSIALLSKQMNHVAVGRGINARRSNLSFALSAIPVSVAILALAWLLPKPDQLLEGISSAQGLREAADNLIYEVGSERVRAYSEPGERLGGPVRLDDEFVMEVTAEERVYLSGSVRDTYTGSSWTVGGGRTQPLALEQNGMFDSSAYSDQLLENQYYFARFYGQRVRSMTISLRENRAKTIYTPPFRTALALPEGYAPAQDSLGTITLDKPLDRYTAYMQDYISWDYGHEYLVYNALRYPQESLSGMEAYLALPASVPERVRELAAELTAGIDNDYDKLQALADYLKTFPYTLEPDTPPRGEDFVDYFLFTGKEGYCVYFASALAVMARSLDIPARYVEGFAMPLERNENGNFTVTNAQAHAWAEAFFPGFGWVVFEATPSDYLDAPQNADSGEQSAPEPASQPEEPVPAEPEPQQPETPDDHGTAAPRPDEQQASPFHPLPVILLAVALVLVLSVLFLRVMLTIYRTRFGRIEEMGNREAATAYFSRILGAAEALGYPRMGMETAHLYAGRVGGALAFENGITLTDLAGIFSRASFSMEEITDDERAEMKTCYQELMRRLRQEMSGPRYFLNRYVLMRF